MREKIKLYGSTVHTWFLSHAHLDHVGALTEILNSPEGINIERIVFNFPPAEWLIKIDPIFEKSVKAFFKAIKPYENICVTAKKGMEFLIDGLEISVLSDPTDYAEFTSVNDSTVVYRFDFKPVTVLFLGDLSEKPGEKLADEFGSSLKSDIVQMAHHGQNGVSKRVYEFVSPDICLWTAPLWLWDNDSGQGYNSGPWATLHTRAWMDEIGAKTHAVIKDGEIIIV